MAGVELQKTVKDALHALYHHPDDVVRVQADRWLQQFQLTLDAWQVADNLLHDPTSNLETLIFCSQTLRSKVQRDFEELPIEAFRPLRDSLTSLLNKFYYGPPKVRTQISLAVAALAAHVSVEDWGDGGIMTWLKDKMNSRPECIPSFLELLKVLPEEVFNYRISARPERRRQFEKELISAMEVSFSLLTACLNSNELKEQVLEAFASWLRLRHGISPSMLASHPLTLTALSSLSSEILSEAAVNAVSELIHCSTAGSSSDASVQLPLIQVIVPQVMSLRPMLNDRSKDEEDVKAIGRLFADMGDSYVTLIATGTDESMMIVNVLLEVTSHPEFEIASMTFNFWHNLQIYLIERDLYLSFGDEASMEVERNRRKMIFCSSYESLVSLIANSVASELGSAEPYWNYFRSCECAQHLALLRFSVCPFGMLQSPLWLVSSRVQYPDDYMELSKEDLKDFKQTRFAVADVLIDAALVLGGEKVLKILYMKLAQAALNYGNDKSNEWRSAEAALYCIRAIAESVPSMEMEVMPQVMSLLTKLPHHPQLLQTVCLTIGAYSKWLDASSNGLLILPSLVDILMSGMSTSEDAAAAAALAFKHICNDCRKKLCGSLDGLFHIYRRAVYADAENFRLSPEDSLHVVEALCMVITELPPDHAKKAMEALCLPVVTPLQDMIIQGPVVFGQKSPRELTVHIDRLAYIFRYVSHPEAVADAIQRLWPIFKTIFDARAWDMRTMESLCKACKYAVRTSGRFMGITIGAMLEEIQGLYQHHLQPCFLYLSSEVIKIFGSDLSCSEYLKTLVEALFGRTTCLLATINDFTTRPDIADDCFLLASRCIRYCPHIFIPATVFPSVIDCAMIGITVQHREASNSILSFLSDVFDLANSRDGMQCLPIRDNVIIPRGPTITRILIASLTGALPSSRFDSVTYALVALLRSYGVKALEWANESMSLLPKTAVTEIESSRFLLALSHAAARDNVNIMGPIEELSDVCRRNRTVQEIVQNALKPLELNIAQRV